MSKTSKPQGSPAGEYPLWNSVLRELESILSAERTSAIAHHARVLAITPEMLTLGVFLEPLEQWLRDGRLAALDACVANLTKDVCELAVLPLLEHGSVAASLTLESFIVSPSNEEAAERAAALVQNPGPHAYPIFLYGPRGSGKTHLLSGIADGIRAQPSARPVLQLSAEEFSLNLVTAIRAGELDDFRARLQNCAALLVDDIERLEGRPDSQKELTQILDTLLKTHHQVAVTAQLPLSQLPELEPALRARLAAGTSLRLRPPEWETRVAIVLDRIARWGVEAPAEVAAEIVACLGEDLHRLDALLTRLMIQPPGRLPLLDPHLVRRVLAAGPRRAAPISPDAILTTVSRHFGLRLSDLRSATRTPRVTVPRQMAMYLLRRHCALSFPEIGQRLRRHHTTAIHAFRKIEGEREVNANLNATLGLLEKELLQRSEAGG